MNTRKSENRIPSSNERALKMKSEGKTMTKKRQLHIPTIHIPNDMKLFPPDCCNGRKENQLSQIKSSVRIRIE